MRMFGSYEHQQSSPTSSTCDIESMDEIPPPSASSILSLNDDLSISNRLSTPAPQNPVTLRFKVCISHQISLIKTNYLFLCKEKTKT